MTAPHLWHYTCAHGRHDVGVSGLLMPPLRHASIAALVPPYARPLMAVVWATDQSPPDPHALGLTRETIECDRTEYRYAVERRLFLRWGRVRSSWPPRLVDSLECADGAEPARWWVASEPVPATLDLDWRRPS